MNMINADGAKKESVKMLKNVNSTEVKENISNSVLKYVTQQQLDLAVAQEYFKLPGAPMTSAL